MSRSELGNVLGYVSKYGFPAVFAVAVYVQFLLPLKDGHLTFLQRTATAFEAQTELMQEMGESQRDISRAQTMILNRLEGMDRQRDKDHAGSQ